MEDTGRFSWGGPIVVLFAFSVVAAVFLPMWLRERRDQRIRREGIPAIARVISIRTTGNYYNEQPEVRIQLEVEPASNERFRAEITSYLSPIYIPRVQPGFILPVRYDPKDRRQVAFTGL